MGGLVAPATCHSSAASIIVIVSGLPIEMLLLCGLAPRWAASQLALLHVPKALREIAQSFAEVKEATVSWN